MKIRGKNSNNFVVENETFGNEEIKNKILREKNTEINGPLKKEIEWYGINIQLL